MKWAFFGIAKCLSKVFRVSMVLVDEEEIGYISHWYEAPKALYRKESTGTES
jgi:hypothetical protein